MEIHRDFPRLRRLVFPTPTSPSLVPKVSCQEGNEKPNPSERLLIVSLSHSILAASIHLHPANIPRLDRSPCHTLSHRIILHALLCIVSHLLLFIYYPSAYLSTDRSINLSSDLLVSADHDNNNNNNSIKPQSQSSFQVKVSLGRVTVQRSAQTYPPRIDIQSCLGPRDAILSPTGSQSPICSRASASGHAQHESCKPSAQVHTPPPPPPRQPCVRGPSLPHTISINHARNCNQRTSARTARTHGPRRVWETQEPPCRVGCNQTETIQEVP